ncbi:MAG: amidohydrolase family protein [Pseudomonadales bacterium]|nr:amidohydrolase family protein [Pseudomonadales bacterium]
MVDQNRTQSWLDQGAEATIEPDQRIIDPHHHLWRRPQNDYLIPDLWRDTSSGHKVMMTVFVECGAEYRTDGPEEARSLGETAFVAKQAELSRDDPEQAAIAGIVGKVDLRLPVATLLRLLGQHRAMGQGLFCGIRHAGAHALYPETLTIPGRAPKDLYQDPDYRRGVRELGQQNLTFDTWHYHHQNQDFIDLAQACPETVIILDHFGTPLGVGPFKDQREEIFVQWQRDMAVLAQKCPNVVAKLGGLAMPDNGFGWSERDRPASSDEFVTAQARYYHHMIDCFGPDRCMFESNFPVDKRSISYNTLYNGLKKIANDCAPDIKDQLFYGTAARVYGLTDP